MADYLASFRQGLRAAQKAESNREEIDAVFEDLNSQIKRESKGTIIIDRMRFKEAETPMESFARVGQGRLPSTYWAITIHNPKVADSDIKQISRWEQNANGYPCTLSFAKRRVYCEDRKSLENSLAELMGDTDVGSKMHALMNLTSDTDE